MRITNPTIIRGYNRSLNRVAKMKDATMKKITSTREFSRASEAPLAAAKALNVRKSLAYSAQHKENLNVASKFYTEAETSLLQVSEKMATIRETMIAACNNGIKSVEEYDVYAQQLEQEAEKLCAVFNTDTAGRAIFGGCSDDTSPFAILKDSNGNASTVTYHGVPVNAMDDPSGFPYSQEVYIDIGLGMKVDQKTQEVDPQSALCVSFNGMEVSGCGAEGGVADIDLTSIKAGKSYCVDVYAGNIRKTIEFTGQADPADNIAEIQSKLDAAYTHDIPDPDNRPKIDAQGVISMKDGIVCMVNNDTKKNMAQLVVDNDSGYTNKYKMDLDSMVEGQEYTFTAIVGDTQKKITFTARGTDDETIDAANEALEAAFGSNSGKLPVISKTDATKGVITAEGYSVKISDVKTNKTDSSFLNNNKISFGDLKSGQEYSFAVSSGTTYKKVTFTAAGSDSDNVTAINNALSDAFNGTGLTAKVDAQGTLSLTDGAGAAQTFSTISTTSAGDSESSKAFERQSVYSANYIQLTLDCARALRNGDIEYANGCIDRIVSSNENLLVEIANLGCNEDFIDFNVDRLTTREYNLDERQNDLECTSLEEQATLLKQYTALYNACLQMASEVVPNSIFNYMK